MKPTMAESKGPIAEARVSPIPVDLVRRLRSPIDQIAPTVSRFVAIFIDTLLVSFVVFPLLLLLNVDPLKPVVSIQTLSFCIAWTLAIIVYHTVLEGIWGVTLGKWLLQITVVAEDLSAIGVRQAFIRNVARVIDALPFVVPYLFGVILARASATKQRWGDRLAKTIVVNV